jgi:hypothetical protein
LVMPKQFRVLFLSCEEVAGIWFGNWYFNFLANMFHDPRGVAEILYRNRGVSARILEKLHYRPMGLLKVCTPIFQVTQGHAPDSLCRPDGSYSGFRVGAPSSLKQIGQGLEAGVRGKIGELHENARGRLLAAFDPLHHLGRHSYALREFLASHLESLAEARNSFTGSHEIHSNPFCPLEQQKSYSRQWNALAYHLDSVVQSVL